MPPIVEVDCTRADTDTSPQDDDEGNEDGEGDKDGEGDQDLGEEAVDGDIGENVRTDELENDEPNSDDPLDLDDANAVVNTGAVEDFAPDADWPPEGEFF